MGALCFYLYVLSTRLISSASGADGGREAADPALLWVSKLLWLQHPGDGESSSRRWWHLLRLQRPGRGGQRGVSREEAIWDKRREGGREEGKDTVFGCESTCECLLACLKLRNVLRLTHAHCVTLGAWKLLCSSKYMSSCWCHTPRGLTTPVNREPPCLKKHCLAIWTLPPNEGYQSVSWS